MAAKVPKPVSPANAAAGAPASTTSATDATSGLTSQTSPKTGQSSPKTGQKEEGSPSSNDTTATVLILLPESPKLHLLSVLGVLIPHTKYSQQESRMESLRWLMWLHQQLPKRVSEWKKLKWLFDTHNQIVENIRQRSSHVYATNGTNTGIKFCAKFAIH